MKQCGSIVVKMIGGSLDGQSFVIMPTGAVGPPQFFCFYAARREEEADDLLVLDTYEAWPPLPCFPDLEESQGVIVDCGPTAVQVVGVEMLCYHQGTLRTFKQPRKEKRTWLVSMRRMCVRVKRAVARCFTSRLSEPATEQPSRLCSPIDVPSVRSKE